MFRERFDMRFILIKKTKKFRAVFKSMYGKALKSKNLSFLLQNLKEKYELPKKV